MHSSGISIWFFIGVLLTVYGAMIFGYGIYEWTSGSQPSWYSSPIAYAGLVGRDLWCWDCFTSQFRPARRS